MSSLSQQFNSVEPNETIETGGLGAHDDYEKNLKRSKKIGAERWCAHTQT